MQYNLYGSNFWKGTHAFILRIAQALIQLLRSWREGDEQEQHSTWEYLKQALDEDRLSERTLFP